MNIVRPTSCRLWLSAGMLVICCGILASTSHALEDGRYLGPSALIASQDGRTLYVANADGRQIAWVDTNRGKTTKRVTVPGQPTGLALAPNGRELFVTCAAMRGFVLALDTDSGAVKRRIPVGHTPMGPVVTSDGRRLFVCNRFDNDVSAIDLTSGRQLGRVAVTREPVAAAITPDGKSVVVANHLPVDAANTFYVAAVVTIIDTKTLQPTAVRLPNGSHSLRDICVSADGKTAFATHVLSNYELVPSQVVQGWTNTNVLSVIDVPGRKLINTIVLDDLDLGAGNPWGVRCTADGKWVCVAHAGTHELSLIDLPAMMRKLLGSDGADGPFYASAAASGSTSNPGILTDIRQRIKLPGIGSRGLAIVGARAYVAQYFTDTVDVVQLRLTQMSANLNKDAVGNSYAPAGKSSATKADETTKPDKQRMTSPRVTTIALGPPPRISQRRRGEILFHDATICYQHWHSCSTCHPDARADGLNWDLRNDGVGNPKNTKSMLLAHRTPPAMVSGIRPSAEVAVRSGIEHILFTEQPEEVAAAMDEYLGSLRPVASPRLVDGRPSLAARRGRRVFEQAGCARCHPAPLYTDLRQHDVGSHDVYDVRKKFDTPSLVEAWRTAPYLHNGKHTTIKDLIVEGKHGLHGGRLERFTAKQIDDLVEYVLSL